MSLTGRLSKTLAYRVDKDIQETLYKNDVFLSSQWSFLEKNVLLWSSYYKKYILLALLLSLLVVTNLVIWQPWVKPYVPQYLPYWRKLLEWQGAFLSGQLTIVGVVYPLVVGFISILFQNISAKKTIIPIYQKCSGFMFSGLSGLALSGFILVGYFLRAGFDGSIYAAICITSAIWLFFNVLLTAWFFVQTFLMLDESSRDRLVSKFSIHESCEYDIRERIKQSLLQNAVHHEILDNTDEQVLEVTTYKYSSSEYRKITRDVAREKSIKNVRFGLINIAIWMQIAILKLHKIEGGKLVIQPLRSSKNGNEMIIARYDGFDMNPLVRLVIQFAFTFEKPSIQAGIGLTAVLNGFVGSANDALKDGDAKEFSFAIDTMAAWHKEFALALSFTNDKGDKDNWMLLSAAGGWGRNYLDELLAEYYRLARDAVEKIPENSRFYNEMLRLHQRIFVSRDELTKGEVRSLIQGSYYMWYLLIEWRSYTSNSSDMRIANKYEDILYDFVGAWESWLMSIRPRSKKVADIKKTLPIFITHLEFTASTAISALRFNNYEAAGWGVDMLNNWLDKRSHDENRVVEYRWHSVLVNHYLFLKDSTDSLWQTILKGNEFDYLAALDLSIKNAHLDLRVLTACYMLLKPDSEHQNLLAKYVKALLSGSRIHQTGAIGLTRRNISTAGELLGAYIRHRDYREYGDVTYEGWLSSILDSFGRIYEERRVSGRIYSGWGANDPNSMGKAYVEIAISLSNQEWRLPNNWEEAILSDAFRHVDRQSIVQDLQGWIKIANEDHDYVLVEREDQEALKANFITSIEGVIEKIRNAQNETVASAAVDTERLKKFGVASSTIFRNTEQSEFPLDFFETIDSNADITDEDSLGVNITGYAKEHIALGVNTNRAVNEDDWLAECITEDVKLNILRALIRSPQSASFEYFDIKSILANILTMSKSMACPVLFVGNQTLLNVLQRSFYEGDLADIYDIGRRDGFDTEYICHIGRCEVYDLSFKDVDYCMLTTKELFDKVSFRRIAESQHVIAGFELDEDSETVGKLKLTYWMKVELKEDVSCIRLNLGAEVKDIE